MFRAFWFLLLLAAFSLGAALLADNPGQMSMQWLGYKIEASVGILFAALFVLSFFSWRPRFGSGHFCGVRPGASTGLARTGAGNGDTKPLPRAWWPSLQAMRSKPAACPRKAEALLAGATPHHAALCPSRSIIGG